MHFVPGSVFLSNNSNQSAFHDPPLEGGKVDSRLKISISTYGKKIYEAAFEHH